jgi:purine-binding chemotaxis protein CheW
MTAVATPNSSGINQQDRSGRYLTFLLGDESYGISVLKVREIIQVQPITSVPRTPEYIKGVINLRGKVIPVVDLRIRFGFAKADIDERTCIVVVLLDIADGREALTGLIVDAVEEVMQINNDVIEDSPGFTDSAVSVDYIYGMAKVDESVKMLLDIDSVINVQTDADIFAKA